MLTAQTGNKLERDHSLWAIISQSTESVFMKAHASHFTLFGQGQR